MKKSIKKCVVNTLAAVTLMSALAIPSFAATPDAQATPTPEARASYYNFRLHARYEWGYANTAYVTKTSERPRAVVNTLYAAGGSVSPSQNFNARICKQYYSEGTPRVAHLWGCKPNAREYLKYETDPASLKNERVRLELSTRNTGDEAWIDGSWSPDAQN